ncbi:MAG: hypothetical protein AAGF57_12595 [Pseudomonadota bacterium]
MNFKAVGAISFALVLIACSDGNNNSDPQVEVDPDSINVTTAEYCDITQTDMCLFPFPNDYFTRQDSGTPTGRRVNFDERAMPVNSDGNVIDPTEFNRNDGFSIGTALLAYVEGLDLAVTGAAKITDMSPSLDGDAPIQLIHAQTGERQLVWAELDQYPEAGEPRALAIRMGAALENGQRYIVVLQNLLDSQGERLEPSDAFKVYQHGIPSEVSELERRRDEFESLFGELESFGIAREDLYLTWDFTTISSENTTARALHMRDMSLAGLSGGSPSITITSVVDNTPVEDASLGRIVEGTIEVPNFMDNAEASPASNLNYNSTDPDALPVQFDGDGTLAVPFVCAIPQVAVSAAAAGSSDAQAVVVGHGLFGSRYSAVGLGAVAEATNVVFCAMDFWGMSEADIPAAFAQLRNISLFAQLPDRLHQAFLNMIFLSEAMVHGEGFTSLPEFQSGDGIPLFQSADVQYYGVSMGSIYGGTLSALSPHFDYAAMDISGMNWSLIIRRANLWEAYSIAFDPSYTNGLIRILNVSLMQMLWDRADSNGLANHITSNPLIGSKVTSTLHHNAIGDQILTETAGEYMHRSLGAQRHIPSVVEGRHISATPFFGIEPLSTYPRFGSAVMYFDSGPFPIAGHDGTPLQRVDNLPRNFGFPNGYGYDPHLGMPIRQPAAWKQKAEYWRSGRVIDVCGDTPCLGDGYNGTPGVFEPAETAQQ